MKTRGIKTIMFEAINLSGRLARTVVVLGLSVFTLTTASAAVMLDGLYSQDFDSMGGDVTWTNDSTLAGWTITTDYSDILAHNNGANLGGGVYNYGSSSGSSDRSMGHVGGGVGAAKYANFYLELQNNTGATITNLTISFDGELWGSGGPEPGDSGNKLAFYYVVGAPTLHDSNSTVGWTAETQLDYDPVVTEAAGLVGGTVTAISYTLTGLSIADGGNITLRWLGANASGSDAGLAIDNLIVSSDDSLITAGDFEGGGTYPGEWRYIVSAGATATYITSGTAGEDVHTGVAAISISNPVNTDERWYLRNAGAIAITNGPEYELSVWVKAESMDVAQTYISLVWLNDLYQPVGSVVNGSIISTNINWTQTAVSGIAPDSAVYLRPTLVVKAMDTGSVAVVTFDDYQLNQISGPLSPYDAWASGYGIDGPDAELNFDYDMDGNDNLLEYAIGGNPTNAADAETFLPTYTMTEQNGTNGINYVYRRRADYGTLGLAYALQITDDLVSGTPSIGTGYTVTGTAPAETGFETVTNRVSVDDPQKFITLRVEMP